MSNNEPVRPPGVRPLCPCCEGGEMRGRPGKYRYTKAKSRWKTKKAQKPRYKDHRR